MSLPSLPYYTVTRLIAEGGSAKVYWAQDNRSGFPVAVKELKPVYMQYENIVELFKSEANKYLNFQHPYMTKLVDFYDHKGRLYIMMEYAEGITLDKYIYEVSGPIPEEKAVKIFLKILDVVDYLHNVTYVELENGVLKKKKGLLHLDIKTNNIMLLPDKENIKLLDLGISANMEDGNSLGTGFGTASYMPPEQGIKGETLGRYTDIFALGIVLFEMLTGRLPFLGATKEETRRKILNDPTPRAAFFYPHINPQFQPILERALAKNSIARYQSCEEMKKDILLIK